MTKISMKPLWLAAGLMLGSYYWFCTGQPC